MKSLLTISLLSLLSLNAVAQMNYNKGYYVDWQHDTVRGYILDYHVRGPERRIRKISFRQEKEGKAKKITTKKVKAYHIENGGAYGAVCPETGVIGPRTRTWFAQIIEDGRLRLLNIQQYNQYENEISIEYFIQWRGMIDSEPLPFIGFRKCIARYVISCEKVHAKVMSRELRRRDIQFIVAQFNSCVKK